ncbi:MAG: ATP-binding protein [Pirellulales bacterium]
MSADLTSSDALRGEVQKLNRRLADLERELAEQRQFAAERDKLLQMEATGKLAGDLAHDFSNLLTIILGYSDVLKQSLRSGDPLQEFIQQIEDAANRAADLTRQLLAFSRKQMLSPISLDMNALVNDMKNKLGRLIGEDIDFVFLPSDNLWHVCVDPGQIEQTIMNVIVNSRDAMSQGGTLTMETRNVALDAVQVAEQPDARPGEYVLVRVSDTGCGMDRATLARIFEPFFSTKGELGSGLGLSMVYGIVKQSGGHIAVHSGPQRGTKFEIYLPRDLQGASAPSQCGRSNASETIDVRCNFSESA